MEMAIFLFWMTFYSGLLGWYSRKNELLAYQAEIDFKKYILPRLLLAHMLACYLLYFLFYSLSSLDSYPWMLFFAVVGTLFAAEYFWIRLEGIKLAIYSSISFQWLALLIGVVVAFFAAVESGVYLEQMTQVPAGVFLPFYGLLILLLVLAVWALLMQFILIIFSCAHMWHLSRKQHPYVERRSVVAVSALSTFVVMGMFIGLLDKKFIPYMTEHHFVDWIYHDNTNLLDQVICTNLSANTQVVLLPTGQVSVALGKENNHWRFEVADCIRRTP